MTEMRKPSLAKASRMLGSMMPKPARKPRKVKAYIEGMWDSSGPEEGDTCDLTVWLMYDGREIMEVKGGTVAQNKRRAAKIASLMNEAGVESP